MECKGALKIRKFYGGKVATVSEKLWFKYQKRFVSV